LDHLLKPHLSLLPQHWCSGFESALSAFLNANREAEASSTLQLRAEIQSRDRDMADLSHQLEQLRTTNKELEFLNESRHHASAIAEEHAQRAQSIAAEAETRIAALEAKLEEQTKRHDEYAGFIAEVQMSLRSCSLQVAPDHRFQECSVKDDLIRDLEAERLVHSSALVDLRSSNASLTSTIEAVAHTLAPIAPGARPPHHVVLHFVDDDFCRY
jgi:predicted RNase H-like nuclease (RuvC/YqgF family)